MADLSAFPVTRQFPPQHPDRLQLYSLPTPNGVKVSILLEELGLPYEVHLVDISKDETWTPEFLSLNPNGKIPAIIDPDGPGGQPLALFESGAILIYLAEKTGKLIPAERPEIPRHVDDPEQHGGREDEGADGRDHVRDLPTPVRQIGVDPPRHAHQPGQVHRQEGQVHAGEHQPEHPFAEPLAERPG